MTISGNNNIAAKAVDVLAESTIQNGYLTGSIQAFFPDLTKLKITNSGTFKTLRSQIQNMGDTGTRNGVGIGVGILVSLGGGKTEGFGLNGSMDFQYYDSYTLARLVDDFRLQSIR